MVRSSYCDKTGLKRGTWTIEEDRKLSAYIQRYGHWNWRELPKFAGLSRCGKSCRLRWMNYLRPNIKRGNYTREEDEIIISLHETLGNRWSAIAVKLPGRTDNEIKNHWHTHLKKHLQQSSKPRKEAIVQPVEVSECESESETNTSLDITSRPSILESTSIVSLSLEKTTCNSASSPNDTKSITTEIPMTDGNISEEIDKSTRNFSIEPFQMAETNLAENYTPKMNYTTYEIPMTRGDSSETIGECSGNFWSEPFQLEESDIAETYIPNLIDLALIFPPSPHYSFYDGNDMEFYLNPMSWAHGGTTCTSVLN